MSDIVGLAVDTEKNAGCHSGVELAQRKKSSREQQLQRLKLALLHARAVILEELSQAGTTLAENPAEVGADIFDRSTSDLGRTLCFLLRERGRNKLNAIDDALERIRDGSFGFCEDCGQKIPLGRLEVMPFATMCRDCKSLQEKRERLFGGENEPVFPYD